MSSPRRRSPALLRSISLVLALGSGAVLGVSVPGCDLPEVTGEPCNSNDDCSDGVFCNGEEICVGSVCAQLDPLECDDGVECTLDACDEESHSCRFDPPDADGDGFGDANCLALDGVPVDTDCDDQNPNRFPGNVERCDLENVDEDCDPSTFGSVDVDGDGYESAQCCNEGPDGALCGDDCDDDDPWITPGAQVCDTTTDDDNDVRICDVDGTWVNADCWDESHCLYQPNGSGVCVPNEAP